MAALTAKATRPSTQEMVGAFTSGYGIFKPIMADMTDMEWATAFPGAVGKNGKFQRTGADGWAVFGPHACTRSAGDSC
jgi:hypothetical protein